MSKVEIEEVKEAALQAFKGAGSSKELYDLKVEYLGKSGQLSLLMRGMGKIPKDERPAFGQLVNGAKREAEDLYNSLEKSFVERELQEKMSKEKIDMTLPGAFMSLGSRHPVSLVINEVVEILGRLGYSVHSGPLIESDWYNFEALNIPGDHPARDMQDTFYIDDSHVLRTHTSPVQIHALEQGKLPLRVIAPGSVFRCDSDVSHSPNFHQIEALLVDKKVSMADLKGTITYFMQAFFGEKIQTRFRPSFFPFTEPSAEFDCSCPICDEGCRMCGHSGWIEIGGCGLVNPNVFNAVKIDPEKWQGFAFGFGIERMAIIKYGIEDIRLFSENDVRFLEQF